MSSGKPGLQAERTALAWARTAAVALVTSILLARHGLDARRPLLFLGALSTTALAISALWICRHRVPGDSSRTALPIRSALATAGLTGIAGLVTLAGMFWAPG